MCNFANRKSLEPLLDHFALRCVEPLQDLFQQIGKRGGLFGCGVVCQGLISVRGCLVCRTLSDFTADVTAIGMIGRCRQPAQWPTPAAPL